MLEGLLGNLFLSKFKKGVLPVSDCTKEYTVAMLQSLNQFLSDFTEARKLGDDEEAQFLKFSKGNEERRQLLGRKLFIEMSEEEQKLYKEEAFAEFFHAVFQGDSFKGSRDLLKDSLYGGEKTVREIENHFIKIFVTTLETFFHPRFFALLIANFTLPGYEEGEKIAVQEEEKGFYRDLGKAAMSCGLGLLKLSSDQLSTGEKVLLKGIQQFPLALGQRIWGSVQQVRYTGDDSMLEIVEKTIWKGEEPTMGNLFTMTEEEELELKERVQATIDERSHMMTQFLILAVKENAPRLFQKKINSYIEKRCGPLIQKLYEISQMERVIKVLVYDYLLPIWQSPGKVPHVSKVSVEKLPHIE